MPKILLLGTHGSKIITQALTKNFLSLDMDHDFPFSQKFTIYNRRPCCTIFLITYLITSWLIQGGLFV
jgi:hypothetical protein